MMTNDEKVNRVALSMQTLMRGLQDFFDSLVGNGQHNVVLVVGADDVVQYVANRDRAISVSTLQSLLARWNADIPDRLPGEVTSGDLRPFTHLLAELERCLIEDIHGVPHLDPRLTTDFARANLMTYVGEQVAKANRGSSQ